MAAKIVLNLEHNEYDDFALTDGEDNSTLWQQDAAEQLKQHLHKNGKEARRYKNGFDGKNIHFSHNAICVHGGRGTGKTVFLKNIDSVWQQYEKDEQDLPKLHFLSSIDPTMLHEHDSFASVIIAQLYNAVEDELSCRIDEGQKDRFYKALRDLANAHGKSSEYEDATGIDRILNYRSGVKEQEYFHSFVLACTHILNCDGVVLRIDDVDMSLDRAFEVLDDVRKFLSCPFIIPVVSGDLALYSRIMENHVAQRLDSEHVKPKQDEETSDADYSLAEAYLTKVFPNHLRINLLPIELLVNRLVIIDRENRENNVSFDKWDYKQYLLSIQELLFPFCNGNNNGKWREPKNARELTQFVTAIPPKLFAKVNFGEFSSTLARDDTMKWWQSWCYFKNDWKNYLSVDSYFRLKEGADGFRIGQLYQFNIVRQIDLAKSLGEGSFAIKKHLEEQVKYSEKIVQNNKLLMDDSINNEDFSLLKMPPLEFITSKLQISKKSMINMPPNLLVHIYTYQGYYSTSNNKRPFVFLSRAFEILLFSVLRVTGNAPGQTWSKFLNAVLIEPPFYSVNALHISTNIELDNDNDDEISDSSSEEDAISVVKKMIDEMESWEVGFKSKFEAFSGFNFFPLFQDVFFKVFTQLNLYRSISTGTKKEDIYLSDVIRRFEYFFINALITSTKKYGSVSNENIAMNTDVDTLSDRTSFLRKSSPARINFSGFLDVDGNIEEGKEEVKDERYNLFKELVSAILSNPMLHLNNKNDVEIPLMGREDKDEELVKDILDEITMTLKKEYGGIRVEGLKSWQENRADKLKVLYEKLRARRYNSFLQSIDNRKYVESATEQQRVWPLLKNHFENN